MIVVRTLADAQEKGIAEVGRYGVVEVTEDGEDIIQLTYPLVIQISEPNSEPLKHILSPYSTEFLYTYYVQIKAPDNSHGFDYTYGNRIHSHFGLNQYDRAVDMICNSPNTRRAVISLWDGKIDNLAKHPPCLNHIQFSRDGEALNMTCLFRSNDILMAYGANIYGLALFFNDFCHDTEYKVGKLTTISSNPHIYYIRDANEYMKWRRLLVI